VPNYVTQYRLVDQVVQRDWQERTEKPLRIIGSSSSVANGLAFYLTSQPSTLDIDNPAETPWVDADRVGREGMAAVCPMPEPRCMGNLELLLAQYPTATTKEVEIVRHHWIGHEPSVRYRIAIIPPL